MSLIDGCDPKIKMTHVDFLGSEGAIKKCVDSLHVDVITEFTLHLEPDFNSHVRFLHPSKFSPYDYTIGEVSDGWLSCNGFEMDFYIEAYFENFRDTDNCYTQAEAMIKEWFLEEMGVTKQVKIWFEKEAEKEGQQCLNL